MTNVFFQSGLEDLFDPETIARRKKEVKEHVLKVYEIERQKEAQRKAKKTDYQLIVEKFECGNKIVLMLLDGGCKQEVLLDKLKEYSDVAYKALWRMKYDDIVKLFNVSGYTYVVLNIDSVCLIQPKSANWPRFSSEVYSAVAERKEENTRVRALIGSGY